MGEAFGGRQELVSNTKINRHIKEQGTFAAGEARSLYDDQTPLPSGYTPMSSQRRGALDQIMQTSQDSSISRQGVDEWQKVMSGAYLDPDSNPWMQDIVDRSVGSAMSGPQSGFAMGGRFGSGAMAHAQADAGQATASRLWGNNYNMERQNMMAAMGQTGAMEQAQYAPAMMQGKVGMEYEADQAGRQAEEMRQYQYPYAKLEQFQSYLTGNPLMAESYSEQVAKQPFQWGQALVGGIGGLFSGLGGAGGMGGGK